MSVDPQPEATTTPRVLSDDEIAAEYAAHAECEDPRCPTRRLLATLDAAITARQEAEHAASAEADGVTRLSNLLAAARQAREIMAEQVAEYQDALDRAEAALEEQTKAHGEDLAKLKTAEFLVGFYDRERERADQAETRALREAMNHVRAIAVAAYAVNIEPSAGHRDTLAEVAAYAAKWLAATATPTPAADDDAATP